MANNELKNLEDGAKEYFDAVKKANEDIKRYLQGYISTEAMQTASSKAFKRAFC